MMEWMITSLVLTALLIALRYLLRGRVSPRLSYALWLLLLVRLLIPVNFGSSAVSVLSAAQKAPAVQAAEQVREVGQIWQAADGTVEGYPAGALMPDTPVTVAREATPQQLRGMENALAARKVLLPLWYLGAGAALAVFLGANLRFARRLRRTRQPLAAEGAKLPVYVTAEPVAPCLFGLLHPAIYVTAEVAADKALLRHALAHETTHYRHGDHIWALLRTLALALHWWDPLVWWAARLSRQDGELACDEATIRRLGESERADYGRTLIRLACGQGRGPLLAATGMDGSKSGLHERIMLIAKKPRTRAIALMAVLLAAAMAAVCTFTGAKKNGEAPAEASPLAAVLARVQAPELNAEDLRDYPNLTAEDLAAAMRRAAAHEISREAAQEAGVDSPFNDPVSVFIRRKEGPWLQLTCGILAQDIVEVTNVSALLSSSVPPTEASAAYFRSAELYELVRRAKEDGRTAGEWMASASAETLGGLDADLYPHLTAEKLAAALREAAAHEITETQAQAAGYPGCAVAFWSVGTHRGLRAACGLTAEVVEVTIPSGARGYFRDAVLYDLLRHSRDGADRIDQGAYEGFKAQLDAVMQRNLDSMAQSPGDFYAYQLTCFAPIWSYATRDGNWAQWYAFDFALLPREPERDFWAGGLYMDSDLGVRGFADSGPVVARYRDDTLLGLVFLGSDESYIPAFDEDWPWAEEMLAAYRAAMAPAGE